MSTRLTTDPKTGKEKAVMIDLGGHEDMVWKSMELLIQFYGHREGGNRFIYQAYLDIFGFEKGIEHLKRNLGIMREDRDKTDKEWLTFRLAESPKEKHSLALLNHAIPELEEFIRLKEEQYDRMARIASSMGIGRLAENLDRRYRQALQKAAEVAENIGKLVNELKNISLFKLARKFEDPLKTQEKGEKVQKDRLKKISLDELKKFWFMMGDLDNISLLNKIFGKQIVGTINPSSSPNILYMRKNAPTLFYKIHEQLNDLMKGQVHKGSGGDEFVPELEAEDIKKELDDILFKFNTYFVQEYNVTRVSLEGLDEKGVNDLVERIKGEKDALGIEAIARYGNGLNILMKRRFRTDEEINRQLGKRVWRQELRTLTVETERVGLFTVSIGAVNAEHLLEYITEKLQKDLENIEIIKTKEQIRSEWLNGEGTGLNPDRIEEFYTWGMRFANDMLQKAKEDRINQETGEESAGRFKVEVSEINLRDPNYIGNVTKKPISLKKVEQTRTALASAAAVPATQAANKDVDSRSESYHPSVFRSKLQESPREFLYMLKVLDYGLNTYKGSTRGFHNAKTVVQEEGGDKIVEMLFKDNDAGIPVLIGDQNLLGTNNGKEGTIAARAPPDTVYIASNQPIRGPPAILQKMRDHFSDKLNDTFKDQIENFRKNKNVPNNFNLNPQLVLIEVHKPNKLPQHLEKYFQNQFQMLDMITLVEWLFEAVDAVGLEQLKEAMDVEESGEGVMVLRFSEDPRKIENLIRLYHQAQDQLLEKSLVELTGIRERITGRIHKEEAADYQEKLRRVAAATLPQTYEAGRKFFSFFGIKNAPSWAIRVFFSMHYELPQILLNPFKWFTDHNKKPLFVVSFMILSTWILAGVLPFTALYTSFLFAVSPLLVGSMVYLLSVWLAHGIGNTIAELINKYFGTALEKRDLHKSLNKEAEKLNLSNDSRKRLKEILDMLLSGEPDALNDLRKFEEGLKDRIEYEKLLEKAHATRFIYLARHFAAQAAKTSSSKKRSPEEILRGIRFSSMDEIRSISNQELAEITSLLNNLLQKSKEKVKVEEKDSQQILTLGLSLAHNEGFNGETQSYKESLRAFKGFILDSYPNTEFSIEFEQEYRKSWEKGAYKRSKEKVFVPTILRSDETLKEAGDATLTDGELINLEGLTPTAVSFLANRIHHLYEQYKNGLRTNRIYLTGINREDIPKLSKALKKLGVNSEMLKDINLDLKRDVAETSENLVDIYNQIKESLAKEGRTLGGLDFFTEKMKFKIKRAERERLQIRVLMILSPLQLVNVTEEMHLFERAEEMIQLSK